METSGQKLYLTHPLPINHMHQREGAYHVERKGPLKRRVGEMLWFHPLERQHPQKKKNPKYSTSRMDRLSYQERKSQADFSQSSAYNSHPACHTDWGGLTLTVRTTERQPLRAPLHLNPDQAYHQQRPEQHDLNPPGSQIPEGRKQEGWW